MDRTLFCCSGVFETEELIESELRKGGGKGKIKGYRGAEGSEVTLTECFTSLT